MTDDTQSTLRDAIELTQSALQEAAKHAWIANEAAHAAYVLAAKTAPTAAERSKAKACRQRVTDMRFQLLFALSIADNLLRNEVTNDR